MKKTTTQIILLLFLFFFSGCGESHTGVQGEKSDENDGNIIPNKETMVPCDYLGNYIGYWIIDKDITETMDIMNGILKPDSIQSDGSITIYNDFTFGYSFCGDIGRGLLNVGDDKIVLTFSDGSTILDSHIDVVRINGCQYLKVRVKETPLYLTRGRARTSASSGLDEIVASMTVLNDYGFEEHRSILSFTIYPDTLQEYKNAFVVDADYYETVQTEMEIALYDSIDICVDEINNTVLQLTCVENGLLEQVGTGECFHLYKPTDDSFYYLLDDNGYYLQTLCYRGKLIINKDAQVGIPNKQLYMSFSLDTLSTLGTYFNSVMFNDSGEATMLLRY